MLTVQRDECHQRDGAWLYFTTVFRPVFCSKKSYLERIRVICVPQFEEELKFFHQRICG